MTKRVNTFLTALAAIALTGALFSGCGEQSPEGEMDPDVGEAEARKADLVYVNWAEGVAYSHVAKVILEDALGFDVTLTSADVGPAYTAVAEGNKDAFMETWLPVLHQDYVEEYGDRIVDLGHVYKGTQSGLVVPSYVTIDKISQMNANKKKFDGKIIGIDAGAGVMKTAEQVIDTYKLDFELVTSSGPAMAAALKDAIDQKEWIAVTGWRPHWKFGRWDLKFLEQDEDKKLWKKGNIHIMGRLNLEQEKPVLATFLRNMIFTDAQLADLMLQVEQSDEDVEVVARQWVEANPDVVDAWLP